MTNLAYTLASLCRPSAFGVSLLGLSRASVSPRSKNSAWVWSEGSRIHAICSARPRSGAKSWELAHLYAAPTSEPSIVALLERASAASASGGAERVFLRVEADGGVAETARLAGFFPCFRETLYAGSVSDRAERGLLHADARLRMRRDEDDHDIFRLYNAAAPLRVRQLAAMTFDQWASSRERLPGSCEERVFEVDGSVMGWLATSRGAGVATLALLLAPSYASLTQDMLDAGLRALDSADRVVALVQDYAPALSAALERRGFRAEGEFAMLVRSTARAVGAVSPAYSSLAAAE